MLREKIPELVASGDLGFDLGRSGYTIDTNRSLAFEAAVREDGKGSWTRFEYSHALGQHWRVTAANSWIRGECR